MSSAGNVAEFVSPEAKEEFHQFLKNTTHWQIMLTIPKTTLTVKPNRSEITKILSVDKDSSIVVISKTDYDKKWKKWQMKE